MSNSKIPNKISPDYLKDTLIELNYKSSVPFEFLIGFFYQELSKDFKLKPKFSSKDFFRLSFGLGETKIDLDDLVFTRNNLKIKLTRNTILFNCLDEYIGWKEYFPLIKALTKRLFEIEQIKVFEKVGIRYISEFPQISIFKHMNNSVYLLNNEKINSNNTTLRIEYKEGLFDIKLNLANNIKKLSSLDDFYSVIDINISSKHSAPFTDLDILFKTTEQLHLKVKDIFFKELLTEKYIDTLNPKFQ